MNILKPLILLLFVSLLIYKPVHAQCPNAVDEAYRDLLTFLNDNHFKQDRVSIGLDNTTENEITIMNNNQHAVACMALRELQPFDQTRDVNEYPGPDKITYYKIRNMYLVVVNNFRFHEVDEDEIWVDLVPTYVLVYNSDFELIHYNFF